MIVDYIDAHRDRFGVDPICTVLAEHGVPIAPSTYYGAKARWMCDSRQFTMAEIAASCSVTPMRIYRHIRTDQPLSTKSIDAQ